jgi:hypothetical protein
MSIFVNLLYRQLNIEPADLAEIRQLHFTKIFKQIINKLARHN